MHVVCDVAGKRSDDGFLQGPFAVFFPQALLVMPNHFQKFVVLILERFDLVVKECFHFPSLLHENFLGHLICELCAVGELVLLRSDELVYPFFKDFFGLLDVENFSLIDSTQAVDKLVLGDLHSLSLLADVVDIVD